MSDSVKISSENELLQMLNSGVGLGRFLDNPADAAAVSEFITEYCGERETDSDDSGSEEEGEDYWMNDDDIIDVDSQIDDKMEEEHDDDEPEPALLDDDDGLIQNEVYADWAGPLNDDERKKIAEFKHCHCKKGKCLEKFTIDYVINYRAQIIELSVVERKMFIIGRISGTLRRGPQTECSKRKMQKDRQKSHITYLIENKTICRETFLFMHCISNKQLTGIIKHYKKEGICAPQRKTVKNANKNALTEQDVTRIVQFLKSIGNNDGYVIPGRVQGRKEQDPRIRLLPCTMTKKSIHQKYMKMLEEVNVRRNVAGHLPHRIAKRTTFCKVWKQFIPHVIVNKPRTDLCWVCQLNSSKVYSSANETEANKRKRLEDFLIHLENVNTERQHYRDLILEAKLALTDEARLGDGQVHDLAGRMHYSFDFAQQVHYPFDPDQPGPVYFLTTRKCGIFGVSCEPVGQQVNYLVDESHCVSKGSNSVITYLHDFFETQGLHEQNVALNCDNCSGQNKNRYLIWYLAWRCILLKHKTISLHFLIAGHTKFAPDANFGVFKQFYRRNMVSSMAEMAEAVNRSSHAGANIARVVGWEDGSVDVPTYNWQDFLGDYFKPLPGIKSLHHLRFSHDEPGVVYTKEYARSPEKRFQLLKNGDVLPPNLLPSVIESPGLSLDRQTYLYERIREFCTPGTRDIVAPKPAIPHHTNNSGDGLSDDEPASTSTTQKPSKRPVAKKSTLSKKKQKT